MNATNGSPDQGNGFLNLLKALGNAILMVFVTPIMLLNELRRELSRNVYSGFDGGIRAIIGALLAFAAAGASGHYLGWVLNWHTASWLSLGTLSWFATYWFVWPLFYLFPVKPAIKGAELAWDAFQQVSKTYADRVFGGLVRSLSQLLPGSASAWTKVLDEKKKDSWGARAVIGLSYPISLAGSAYAGYQLYLLVSACFSTPLVGVTLGVGAGLLAGLSLLGAIWQCIEYGKIPFVAVALGIGLDRVFSIELGGFSSLLHLNGYFSLLTHVAAVVLFVGYVFPLFYLLLSGAFIKWAIERLKPLAEKTYDDRDKDYGLFFHSVTNLAVTAIALYEGFVWAQSIALSPWALVPALAALGLFAYLWFYDVVDHGGGTFITGLLSSAYVGWLAGSNYFAHALPGGIWMAIPVGILSVLATASLLFPLAYLIAKSIFVFTRVSKLGQPLSRLHKAVEDGFHRTCRELWHAYDNSYRDRSGYQIWFLHAANLVVAGLAAFYLPVAVTAAHAHAWAFIAPLLAWSASVMTAAQVLCGLLSYILVGRFLQRSNVGTEFIGALSSLALAVWLSSYTVAVGSSAWASVVVGLLGWIGGFFLVFPIAYILFRFPARYLLASWTSTILVKVHDFAWSAFLVVWNKLVAVYEVVQKAVFVPIINAIAAASRRVSEAYNWLRDKILHRSK